MSVFLFDVNVLIALIDPNHVHHDQAHEWFQREGHQAWSTCPLTENGLLRIVGSPGYPNSPGSPSIVARLLVGLRALQGHQFWADDISLTDTVRADARRLLTSAQVTDSYQLSLAAAHGGHLTTFDRRLVTDAVPNGAEHLRVLA